MSTDPISEARREFEAWVWPGTVEMRTMTDAELDAAKDTAFAHLRAAILASDPRRAALETALRKIADDDHRKDDEYAGAAYDRVVDAAYRALKALEETAVEETRS